MEQIVIMLMKITYADFNIFFTDMSFKKTDCGHWLHAEKPELFSRYYNSIFK